jgi:hypothetical protein
MKENNNKKIFKIIAFTFQITSKVVIHMTFSETSDNCTSFRENRYIRILPVGFPLMAYHENNSHIKPDQTDNLTKMCGE